MNIEKKKTKPRIVNSWAIIPVWTVGFIIVLGNEKFNNFFCFKNHMSIFRILKLTKSMKDLAKKNPDEIANWQREKLTSLVNYAKANSTSAGDHGGAYGFHRGHW